MAKDCKLCDFLIWCLKRKLALSGKIRFSLCNIEKRDA